MKRKWVLGTGLFFLVAHLGISGYAVGAASLGDSPEWGMPLGACLTTLPLADFYDAVLFDGGLPTVIQLALPVAVGAVIYWTIGPMVGYGIASAIGCNRRPPA